ncbi:hypothetical protein NDU88_002123 [Pleurodeles waltl]|uniref:Uncharacterized protein n=1 Tax=Pleurodeles waltl TaxID=8319 RepID=A0AAV7VCY1_PLEWA|nr:hypothetical protein NDU88_002123 [Pleurodeles waltl]
MQSYAFYAHRTLNIPWIVASPLQKTFLETTSARGVGFRASDEGFYQDWPGLPRPDRELRVRALSDPKSIRRRRLKGFRIPTELSASTSERRFARRT